MCIFTLTVNQIFIMSSQNHEENSLQARFGFANCLALFTCFISYEEVGAERKVFV